jgi:hypothetical protein
MVVQEKYQLSSDPCDYRLIRISNCLQFFACICHIIAIFNENLRNLADCIQCIANVFYHSVSGCMTAQTAHEIDYRSKVADAQGGEALPAAGEVYVVKAQPAGSPETSYQPPPMMT